MIKVKVIRKNDIIYGFRVSGHALFDNKGKDIVCAAVSMLTINTVNAFETFLPDEAKNVNVDPKRACIECVFENEPSKEARLLMDTFLLGIRGTEKEYGHEFLKLEE